MHPKNKTQNTKKAYTNLIGPRAWVRKLAFIWLLPLVRLFLDTPHKARREDSVGPCAPCKLALMPQDFFRIPSTAKVRERTFSRRCGTLALRVRVGRERRGRRARQRCLNPCLLKTITSVWAKNNPRSNDQNKNGPGPKPGGSGRGGSATIPENKVLPPPPRAGQGAQEARRTHSWAAATRPSTLAARR